MSRDYTIRLENSLVKAVELPEPSADSTIMSTYAVAKGNITEREQASEIDIPMLSVESSNIKSVGYHYESKQFRILFTNGGLYHYKEVPSNLYDEMMQQESVSQFFSKHIRSNFECIKLN